MNSVVHFEMPYEDRDRMKDFYVKAFGWKTQVLGPEMGNYVVVHTGPTDNKNMPEAPGFINGGFYKKSKDMLGQSPSVVISVNNIEQAMQSIREAGGKMLGEPMDIPGIGRYAGFLDTEGNRASLLEPAPR